MGEYEDYVRSEIERKFGSIPKMSAATGIAKNTIYHALERGLDNTTTKTRRAILDPLFGDQSDEDEKSVDALSSDDAELLDQFHKMDDAQQSLLLAIAYEFARKS